MDTMNRERGYVTSWRFTWGWITPDQGSKDVFVHQSAVEMDGHRELSQGQRVSFTRGPGPDGREVATAVKVERES